MLGTIGKLAVRSAKNPKSHPYPSQPGRIRGYEASSGGKCRIIYWFGCSWLAVDGLRWPWSWHIALTLCCWPWLGVHDRTLVNSDHGQKWGAFEASCPHLGREHHTFGARWHPFGLGFAVVAMVRMPIFPDPHPLRPLHCGVSHYAPVKFFGKRFPWAFDAPSCD